MSIGIPIFFVLPSLLLVVGAVVLVVVLLTRKPSEPNSRPDGVRIRVPKEPMPDRAALFRKRHQHYNEERSRILGMVDEGTISADEAQRLLESLERETAVMACPFCQEEIRVEAVKCKHCGSYLTQESASGNKRLTKSGDKLIAGVCGGLAEYANMDPSLIRILVVIVGFVSGILPLLLAYIIAAIVLPDPS